MKTKKGRKKMKQHMNDWRRGKIMGGFESGEERKEGLPGFDKGLSRCFETN